MNQVVFRSYLSNSFSRRRRADLAGEEARARCRRASPRRRSEPSQPATASTSTPMHAEDLLRHLLLLPVAWWYNATPCARSAVSYWRSTGPSRTVAGAGATLPGRAAEPRARPLRAAARRLERARLRPARPQGALGRRRQPRRAVGRGRAARRRAARPARPGSCPRPRLTARRPVALVTGFLGSGKTTLLSRLLAPSGDGRDGGDRQRARRGRRSTTTCCAASTSARCC